MQEAGTLPSFYGIRLDSGDLAYLSKEAHKMFAAAGFPNAVIAASNDLDENLIAELKLQGCAISSWGERHQPHHGQGQPFHGRRVQDGRSVRRGPVRAENQDE